MLEAVKDKVIVEVLKRVEETKIIVPNDAILDPQGFGVVISKGPEVSDDVKQGDYLFFHHNGGMDSAINRRIFKILKYDEVYGKVTDKELISKLQPLKLGPPKEDTPLARADGSIIQSVK